jgi:undecaprenyl-diphosphatase
LTRLAFVTTRNGAGIDHIGLRQVEIAAVCAGAALLSGSWALVAAKTTVPAWEETVFTKVNDLPDAVWPIAWAPMQLGSLAGSVGIVGLTAAVTRDRRLAAAAFVASQGAWWSAKAVKRVVSRGRPAALLNEVKLRESASGLGYVSGHSAVAFGLATALAPSLPRRWRPAVFAAAAVVGVCRLYAGAHLPLDVVGGVGVGILSGTAARAASF